MNQPFIIKLPKVESKNLDFNEKKENIMFSPVLTYPLFTLGFHSFIHRTRSAMEITKNLQSKTEFYYVVNPFEPNISNYEDDIKKLTELYFNKVKDIDNEFLNLWEILFTCDVVNKSSKNIFMLSNNNIIDLYKDKINLNNKFNIIDNEKNLKKNNDIDLIIASNTMKVNDENFIEQEFYKEFISYLITVLNNQSENGNCIIKYYDSFCIPTLKIIYLITSFYNESFIYKPFISRQSNSERYLILKDFKSSKNLDKVIKILEGILKSFDNKNYVFDILPDLNLPGEYMSFFTFVNTKLVNNQQIMINEIIKYIKENNYFGDKYHIFRDKQIESSKWWIKNFYPPSENIYEKNREDLGKLYKVTQEKLNLECQKFIETLVPLNI
jgi:hypothetical protein